MMKKYLKKAFWVLLLSGLFAGSAVWTGLRSENEKNAGRLVFANAIQKFHELALINIETPSLKVSLALEDSLWRVREEDNYFADYALINRLFDNIRSAAYTGKTKEITDSENGLTTRIILSRKDGNLLNDVAFVSQNGEYYIKSNDNKASFISAGFQLPTTLASWVKQPVLAVEPGRILSVAVGDGEAVRPETGLPFSVKTAEGTKEIRLDGLFNSLRYVPAEKVLSVQNFDETRYSENKTLTLTTYDGLITGLNIFKNEENYFLKITLSATNLPTTETSDYIKNNAFLYDGWYFQISPVIGSKLFNFALE